MYELQQAIYFRVQKEYGGGCITKEVLQVSLLDVLEMLKVSLKIFSFDSPSSLTGRMSNSIPESMRVVKEILRQVCDYEVADDEQ